MNIVYEQQLLIEHYDILPLFLFESVTEFVRFRLARMLLLFELTTSFPSFSSFESDFSTSSVSISASGSSSPPSGVKFLSLLWFELLFAVAVVTTSSVLLLRTIGGTLLRTIFMFVLDMIQCIYINAIATVDTSVVLLVLNRILFWF